MGKAREDWIRSKERNAFQIITDVLKKRIENTINEIAWKIKREGIN